MISKPYLKKYFLGILIIIPCLMCTNLSIANDLSQEEKKEQKEVPEILGLELMEVIKSTGGQYITQKVQFSTSEDKVKTIGIAKPLQPKTGHMFVLMKLNLINSTDKKITFKLSNLKAATEAEDKITLMYLATFDDKKKSYTIFNINPPEVESQGKTELKLMAIVKDTCPMLTLKYSEGNPIQVKLSSIKLSSTGNEQVTEAEHKQVRTILLGKPLSTKFKGKKFTVYLTRIIPGRKNIFLAHAYYDKLPAKVQKHAAKLGYKSGDAVNFAMGEKKGDIKILPPGKK